MAEFARLNVTLALQHMHGGAVLQQLECIRDFYSYIL